MRLGLDLALRHGAAVLADADGRVLGAWQLTERVAEVATLTAAGVHVTRRAVRPGLLATGVRLVRLAEWLRGVLDCAPACPVVLEGVAFHGGSSQRSVGSMWMAHGVALSVLAEYSATFSVVDTQTITRRLHGGKRGGGKDATAAEVLRRWGKAWPGDYHGDLADAHALAMVGGDEA